MGYRDTLLWQNSLGARFEGTHEVWRGRLNAAFLAMRRQAITLSREIARDLPTYTVHDETHLDALWEIAELIGGPNCKFNPCEAFLFGGAVLCHDLAMSVAAYPGGVTELRANKLFNQGAAILYPDIIVSGLNSEQADKVQAWVIRENHAAQAASLPLQVWNNAADQSQHTLIEDTELREAFGPRIGSFAASHWWPLPDVITGFSERPGPPGGAPPEWTIDEFKIAALLRAADASHIDARRAPSFLFTLRRLAGIPAQHWLFQKLLQTPTLPGSHLEYFSSRPFSVQEADAWWLCYDTINMIDRELSAIDRYLDAERPADRFAARGVRGGYDPESLARTVRTVSWYPVDARPSISNIGSLIERLGGKELYGAQELVPLRELLQNAIDATDAAITESPKLERLSLVSVSLTENDGDLWLVVEDNGIGMSRATILNALLDFGTSLWTNEALRKEHPRLLERRFKAIGKYGIGFFSVFMWSDHVEVITRSHDTRKDETLVLEFRNALRSRPILRLAVDKEFREVGGTSVRLKLKNKRVFEIMRSGQSQKIPLVQAVRELIPFPTVPMRLSENDSTELLEPIDWRVISAEKLLSVLHPSVDKSVASRLKNIVEVSGDIVGRATFQSDPSYNYHDRAVVVGSGGISVGRIEGLIGILLGEAANVARDRFNVQGSRHAARSWASAQAKLSRRRPIDEQLDIAEQVASIAGSVGELKVARVMNGVVNLAEISQWVATRNYVVVVANMWDQREGDPIDLRDNVIFVNFSSSGLDAYFIDENQLTRNYESSLIPYVINAVIAGWRRVGFKDPKRIQGYAFIDWASYRYSKAVERDIAQVILTREEGGLPADLQIIDWEQ